MSTQESVAALKAALQTPNDDIAKSFVQPGSATAGLQGYDLEAPAKTLIPMLTPLRNQIPRDVSGYATQANWKAVTGINVGNMSVGVSEGKRSGLIATSTAEYFAAFRALGTEDDVTFEADMASKNFDDVKARAVQGTLQSLMIGEELVILGGNTSVALGTTPTPTLVAAAGGSLAAAAISVICVALGFEAAANLQGRNNGATGQTLNLASAAVPQAVTRNNADGTTSTFGGGSAQKSAAAAVTPTLNQQVTASVVPVANAYGYAWFWGAAGSEVLGAITTVSAVVLKTTATGAQTAASLAASDNSVNALHFDGILTQIQKSGSGSYVKALDGVSKLTSDGAGGIVEISEAFISFWNLYKLSPSTIYVNVQEQAAINKLVIANGGASLIKMNTEAGSAQNIVAGRSVSSILNPITGTLVDIVIHSNMPAGTVMFYSKDLPYKLSNISAPLKMKMRRDYYSMEWPVRTRKYEYGVYMDGVLQNYFPPAFGVITNIAK